MNAWTNEKKKSNQQSALKTGWTRGEELKTQIIQNAGSLMTKNFWKSLISHVGIRYLELPLCHIHFSLSPNGFIWKVGVIVLPSPISQRAKMDKKNKTILTFVTNTWKTISMLLTFFPMVLQILKMFQFTKMSSSFARLQMIPTIGLTSNSQGWYFQILLKVIICLQINYTIHICLRP